MKRIQSTLLFVFIVLTMNSFAQPGQWSEPVNIGGEAVPVGYPDICVGTDGSVYAVWVKYNDDTTFLMTDIFFNEFDGIQWGQPLQLSDVGNTQAFWPHVAVDSQNHPHVVWNHNSIYPNADIYYTMRTDSGWIEPINIAPNGSTQYLPDIAIDSQDNIHVVWTDYITGNYAVFHKYYNGIEWSEAENVSNDTCGISLPILIVDSEDNLHLACVQSAISGMPCKIVYYKKTDNEWSEKFYVSQNNTFNALSPDITVDEADNPHIVWQQFIASGGFGEIYGRYCEYGIWSEVENLTNLGMESYNAHIAFNCGVKFVSYCAQSDTIDPYFYYNYNLDSVWSLPQVLFPHNKSSNSSLYSDNNNILHCVVDCSPSTGISLLNYTYFTPRVSVEGTDYYPQEFKCSLYPNPFNSNINISYMLITGGNSTIYIYNIKGEIVKSFKFNNIPSGEYKVCWDGTNQSGKEVSAGIYFVSLEVGGEVITKKIILLR
jgi:hypothetical protein